MLLRSDVNIEALFICDEQYNIGEYVDEGVHENNRNRGCQMEGSRPQGHEQRPLQYRCSGTNPQDINIDDLWHRWSDSYLQVTDSGRYSIRNLKATNSAPFNTST